MEDEKQKANCVQIKVNCKVKFSCELLTPLAYEQKSFWLFMESDQGYLLN